MLMLPASATPALLAVIEALFMVTVFVASTVIAPPVAVTPVPEVLAESVPPFWSVTVLALSVIFPPAPVPSVLRRYRCLGHQSESTEPACPSLGL
jgi:hypothetical protein